MGSPADLAFRCRGESPTMAVGNVFKALPKSSREIVDRAQILDEYLKALEDERRKIEAFKRELPHCMQLLEYAIDASRENLVQSPPCSIGHPIVSVVGKSTETLGLFGKQVVQEFLKSRWDTIKDEDSDESEKKKARRSSTSAERDYPAWMAEAQLWSQPASRSDTWKEKGSSTEDSVGWKKEVAAEKSTLTSPPALLFNAKQRPGGAFMPFVKEKQVPIPAVRADPGVSDLVLSSGESRRTTVPSFGAVDSEAGSVDGSSKPRDVSNGISQGKEAVGISNGGGIAYSGCTESTTSSGGVAQRKARRCWSPELHRRFVSALQQLGGSQIATPKQIRELMKVDGLTNDEVKSHLQKYRLHTRRPSPTPQGPTQPAQAQVVVLGGLWVPPEYGNTGMYHDHPSSVSASQPEPIFCQPYPKLPPPPIQIELRRSQSQTSPQGPPQSTTSNLSSGARQTTSAECCRDDSAGEDGKSESCSSKEDNDDSRDSEEEKEEVVARKYESRSKEDDEDDEDEEDTTDEGNQDGSDDGEVRLQLEMSCSSAHGSKADPQTA